MKYVISLLLIVLAGCKDARPVMIDGTKQGKPTPGDASYHQEIPTNMESISKLIEGINSNADPKKEEAIIDELAGLLRVDYSNGRGFITIAPVVGSWGDNEKPQVFLLTLNRSKSLEKVAAYHLKLNQSKNIRRLMLVE